VQPRFPDLFARTVAGRLPDAPGDPDGDTWLALLPRLVNEHLGLWELVPDGNPWHGECAVVIPVRRRDEVAALKLTWPHPEARHEHLALRLWDGRGAVRLLAADPTAYALLLERLDGDRDLTSVPILDACEVIGTLFTKLDRPSTLRRRLRYMKGHVINEGRLVSKYDLDTTREATRRILADVTGGSESTLVEVRRGSGEDGSLILDAYVTVP
jgi:streptomycin 6-kinase